MIVECSPSNGGATVFEDPYEREERQNDYLEAVEKSLGAKTKREKELIMFATWLEIVQGVDLQGKDPAMLVEAYLEGRSQVREKQSPPKPLQLYWTDMREE